MKYKDDFFDYITYEKKYSIHTVNNYKKVVLEYLEFLDKECIDIKDANNLVVRNYLRSLDKHNYSNKTLCLYISSLRSFYKYLLKNRVIKSNPMVLIKNPKLEKRVPKFLYYNELSSLFESIDTSTVLGIRDNLILEILYSTGVRVSELVSIKLSDINNFDKSITIFGKGKKSRIVLFGDTLESALNLYLNKSRNILIKTNTDILLLNKNGTPLTDRGVRLIISKIVEKASIKQNVSPHVLRHTFATHLLKEGADLKTVQELLGHATLSATEVYTHVTNEGLRKTYLDCHPRGRK
ncbi:MAG: tyrosine recombinase [Firmicutes bacterium]|nr:tyrosine recombinase [Bacillota bacterium]